MILVAVDPGETSGYARAVITFAGPHSSAPQATLECVGEWRGILGLIQAEDSVFGEATHLVFESYRVYPHKAAAHTASDLYTAQEIGRLKLIAIKRNLIIDEQTASQAKQLWPTSRLKRHFPTVLARLKGAHQKDALRHLFTYMEIHQIHRFFKPEEAI
jgi:hypothetical protein